MLNGIQTQSAAVHALIDEIEARLDGLGLVREDRPFRAHLTLGRVRAPIGPAARQGLASVAASEIGSCDVREVTLFESRLSPRGPTYTAIRWCAPWAE